MTAKKSSSPADLSSLTYEEIVAKLESTIAEMERPDVGIERLTSLFEEAGSLRILAQTRLDALRSRIDALLDSAEADDEQDADD